MIPNDLKGKAVLITGGTKGIGLATGLAFAREGAQVWLTNKWGSADDSEIAARFADAGALAPIIVEADASQDEDTLALLARIKEKHDRVEVFVSNVAFAQVTDKLENFRMRSFLKGLDYSAWPMVGYMQHIRDIFGAYPRYNLGLSSDGADNYYPGYAFVAASKAVMETFVRYLATHVLEQDCRVNVLRARPVSTDSLEATFGPEFEPFLRKYGGDDYLVGADQVGETALALCSGLMDAVSGQVLTLDNGVSFSDNVMRMFEKRDSLRLKP